MRYFFAFFSSRATLTLYLDANFALYRIQWQIGHSIYFSCRLVFPDVAQRQVSFSIKFISRLLIFKLDPLTAPKHSPRRLSYRRRQQTSPWRWLTPSTIKWSQKPPSDPLSSCISSSASMKVCLGLLSGIPCAKLIFGLIC